MLGETAPLPRRVDYYESETTSSNFQSKKDEFAKAGIPTKEIWVFYGTFSDENIKRIMSEGFKVGGSQVKIKNGSAYGRGVYTATGPRAPQGYGKKTNKVILARGLVGTEGVHSKTPQDDWYLFMDGHQLLPVYVLHM
uniref:PARP catalytic domain-containing protein n=1 Tax=Aureoumbra lagunensis TaxID=44058 RepID=A0A6S8EHV3_9STRA|mmetsp:Transcript_10256/g.15517  ORF Transcript_10256/g.15517 Transcript_10256/m.15517 type:complete len:138 (+) Transcript_10256:761-1174(+)